MTSHHPFRAHSGGRTQCVNEMHEALYLGLINNDQSLIDHALKLDRRLAQRADLYDINAISKDHEQASQQD